MTYFSLEMQMKMHENEVYQVVIQQRHTKVCRARENFRYLIMFIIELEEKDEAHLKCPEDTTSIGSNSVCDPTSFLYYYCRNLVFG